MSVLTPGGAERGGRGPGAARMAVKGEGGVLEFEDPTATSPVHAGFEDLFDGMQDAALILAADSGRIRRANAAAGALLGFEPEELRGMRAQDFHEHELPRLEAFFMETLTYRAWQRDDLSCRCRDGKLIPAEVRGTVFAGADEDELLVMIRDLRGEQLAEVGRSVRKLVHDLRNLLATAQLLSDRLSEHDDPKVHSGADVMSRSLERALELCHQTMKAGRAEEGPPDRVRFLIDEVVEEVAATGLLPPPLGPRFELAEGAGTALDADFDQVYRILLNLVRNAADAGATVMSIAAVRDSDTVRLSLRDDGPGLPEFVQADLRGEKHATGSTGLGLMIAAELAEAHGGALRVAETGPAGTVFVIELPDAG